MSSSSSALSLLFSPLQVGNITLRNRIVSSAHGTGLSDGDRLINDRTISYYEVRAKGGVAMMVTGATSVHKSDVPKKVSLANWADSVIAPYRKLADAVHRHGSRMLVQLNHAGAQAGVDGVPYVVGPSTIPSELLGEIPHPLEKVEIDEIVQAFAAAALRVKESGLDGVEIHGAHGNLIQQFMSPQTNLRSDDYGGDLKARTRFALEVVRAVRAAVGRDFVVGMRICVKEDHPHGISVEDMQQVSPLLVEAGQLDYFSTTSGTDANDWSKARHYASMYAPRQHMCDLARAIRSVVSIPVMAAGRIVDPRDAEAVLAAGDADLVAMTRALIADRDMPNKAKSGEFDQIRFCVGANEGCIGRRVRGKHITCIQNPTSAREQELGELVPAAHPKRVVVVGGGVAGLEAARVAALRGHHTILLEKTNELGGQVKLACRAPGRSELAGITDYLARMVAQLKVDIRYGYDATAQSIAALDPNCVVVATGSTPLLPKLHDEYDRLISPAAAMDGAMVGNPVVVFDTRGDIAGLTTADWLAGNGYQVTVVTSLERPGIWIEPFTRAPLLERLHKQNVPIIATTEVSRLTDEGIMLLDLPTGRETLLADIATVVAACGGVPNDTLLHALKKDYPALEIHAVGDARAAREIERAIYEGHMIGREL